jgi:hypothetical protein
MHIGIHASSGIRILYTNIGMGGDSSWAKPRCCCDWFVKITSFLKFVYFPSSGEQDKEEKRFL